MYGVNGRGWAGAVPPTVPFALNRYSSQGRDLLGWWPTLQNAGDNLLPDYSGADRHLTAINSPARIVTREMGPVVSYDGASNYYEGTFTQFLTRPMTLAAWVYPTDTDDTSIMHVVNSTFVLRSVSLYRGGTNAQAGGYQRSQNNIPMLGGAGTAPLNTWTHIVNRIITPTLMELYVNGVYETNNTGDAGASEVFLNNVTIGCRLVSVYAGFFGGYIGDARVYGRGLSPGEIWQLYNPATRWDLYAPVNRIWPAAVAGAPVSGSPWYQRLQQVVH